MNLASRGQNQGTASSQAIGPTTTIPSPEVAELGTFGLIPASPFTGQADVSIPLYDVSYRDISVPITLRYDTKGNKADDHPTWVGLGWSLQAGGAIYRKVNGLYDETTQQFAGNTRSYNYYDNCGRVTRNFNNNDSMAAYLLWGQQSAANLDNNSFDSSPDEFIFNFNQYSGSFFLYRQSPNDTINIRVRSNGSYKLKADILEIKNNLDYDDQLTKIGFNGFTQNHITRAIYKIRIIDEKGTQYIFGGNVNAIEFNTTGSFSPTTNTITSTWHLTEIRSPLGAVVTFDYKRVGRTHIKTIQRDLTYCDATLSMDGKFLFVLDPASAGKEVKGSGERMLFTVHNPVYLASIKTPSQEINFSSSRSTELGYEMDYNELSKMNGQVAASSSDRDSSHWQKLDGIDIVGIRKIKFNYLEQRSRRLQLSSLELKTILDRTLQTYTFSYNSRNLPGNYNARLTDHWGYYNGKLYKYTQDYLNTRTPDANYMNAEMLEKITYPTGGYLKLVYEPHSYSKAANQYPNFDVVQNATDNIAGGLRIKKLIAAADAGATPIEREYFYNKDYLSGGTRSSGILAANPVYMDEGSVTSSYDHNLVWRFARVMDNSHMPLSTTNGNHITYSEVTEKSNGGYTVYKYSNHDNGYQDKAADITISSFSFNYDDAAFISMESYRGMLLSSEIYNSQAVLLKKTSMEYSINTTSSEYWVPDFYRFETVVNSLQLVKIAKIVHYTKPPLLTKVTDVNYAQGGSGQAVTTVQVNNYFENNETIGAAQMYDNYQPVSSKIISSKGDVLTSTFVYPYTKILSGNDPNGLYKKMLSNNLNANVLTRYELKNNVQVSLTNTGYYENPYGKILPQYFQRQAGTSDEMYTDMVVDRFDDDGTILNVTKRGGLQMAYLWDCKHQYPIASAVNATAGNIQYFSFENNNAPGCENAANVKVDVTSPSGNHCCYVDGRMTLSRQIAGWTTSLDHIVSYWSKSGAFTVPASINMVQGKTLNGWTYYEHLVRNVENINLEGTGYVDEIRVYPANAQLTTYAYLPNIGMIAQCDAKNNYTFYEYDTFGRLHLIRDQNKHIIKMICYNYKGEEEICNENIYYSKEIVESARACEPYQYGVPSSSPLVPYEVKYGKYISNISQADADQKAQTDVNENKVKNAQKVYSCQFYNQRLTSTPVEKQCTNGYRGTTSVYVVDSMTYFNPYSQADADEDARADIRANAQTYANDHGTCYCSGEDKKVINGYCETGKMEVVGATVVGGKVHCVYRYRFSDGSVTSNITDPRVGECTL
ncbi:DUF5977 domain-containing protein [Chitinophaga sancti]|uniref:DUF5977 domain-containing protein n=1 Tax=Chitinophaga sancti TaxID=1004 RepID=A0ABZ0XBE0_9BACT|nr:DUF5977 domain-containing protein [Chitinophaga sancti]WQD60035.1 DUF5977 domain-containing protein [Chitinophaga sancti]WQG87835.1 DUF5977 domain-containing protein [Chitinophaga sancti]